MDKYILPNYKQDSILNFIASLLHHFKATHKHEIIQSIDLSSNKILIFLLDAVGYNQFKKVFPGYHPKKLTTVFPSTTATALTSIFTEKDPIQHGILGFTTYLGEYGIIANCITMKSTIGNIDLSEYFYQDTTIFKQLSNRNVESHILIPYSISGSGLSKILYRGSMITPYYSFNDISTALSSLKKRKNSKQLIVVYYPNYDTLCHKYGPSSHHAKNELKNLFYFIEKISTNFDDYNIFVMADHGQIDTPKEHFNFWQDYPKITSNFIIPPFCEPRVNMFFEKHDFSNKLYASFDNIILFTKEEILNNNFFGNGNRYSYRLGNKTMIAIDDSVFMSQLSPLSKPPIFLGMHGSISPDEIFVPLLQIK